MSRLAPNELSSKPYLSNAARQLRTNSSDTTGYVGSACDATISMPGPMPSSATRASRLSKSYQPARNSALAEYSVRPSLKGSASVAGGGGGTSDTRAGGAASRSVAVSVSVWFTKLGTYMPGPPSSPGAICM